MYRIKQIIRGFLSINFLLLSFYTNSLSFGINFIDEIDEKPVSVIISMETESGEIIFSLKKFPLYKASRGFRTKNIQTPAGIYNLLEFAVLDNRDEVIAIAPFLNESDSVHTCILSFSLDNNKEKKQITIELYKRSKLKNKINPKVVEIYKYLKDKLEQGGDLNFKEDNKQIIHILEEQEIIKNQEAYRIINIYKKLSEDYSTRGWEVSRFINWLIKTIDYAITSSKQNNSELKKENTQKRIDKKSNNLHHGEDPEANQINNTLNNGENTYDSD